MMQSMIFQNNKGSNQLNESTKRKTDHRYN